MPFQKGSHTLGGIFQLEAWEPTGAKWWLLRSRGGREVAGMTAAALLHSPRRALFICFSFNGKKISVSLTHHVNHSKLTLMALSY